jgi:hypothetical protein
MSDEVSFPSLAWFRALAQQLEADSQFKHLARWTDARIGFSVMEKPTIVLTLVAGRIVSVEEGMGLKGVDYCLEGPREGWNVFFEERGSLPLATNQLYGKLRISGNIVLAAGDSLTLDNICRRFRSVREESESHER